MATGARRLFPLSLSVVFSLSSSGCGSGTTASTVETPAFGQALTIVRSAGSTEKVTTDFTLHLVGEVAAASRNGVTLQANDLYFNGTKAYIGSNVAGATQMGAVQVVDVSRAQAPQLLSTFFLDDTDVNGLYVDGTDLFVVGATTREDPGPAILKKIGLTAAGLPDSEQITGYALPSYAGTSVFVANQKVYALSGDNGGLTVFERASMALASQTTFADARSVRGYKTGTTIYALGAQPGKVHAFTAEGALQQSHTIGGAQTPESKSTLSVGKSMALASVGEAGAHLVCLEDGVVMTSVPAVTVPGLDASRTVTNSVASSSGLLFTANGEAGIHVYSFKSGNGMMNSSRCRTVNIELLGAIDFGSAISANFAHYQDGYLFVATGLGGMKVIALSKEKKSDDDDDFE